MIIWPIRTFWCKPKDLASACWDKPLERVKCGRAALPTVWVAVVWRTVQRRHFSHQLKVLAFACLDFAIPGWGGIVRHTYDCWCNPVKPSRSIAQFGLTSRGSKIRTIFRPLTRFSTLMSIALLGKLVLYTSFWYTVQWNREFYNPTSSQESWCSESKGVDFSRNRDTCPRTQPRGKFHTKFPDSIAMYTGEMCKTPALRMT
jgi:hypothetical protein